MPRKGPVSARRIEEQPEEDGSEGDAEDFGDEGFEPSFFAALEAENTKNKLTEKDEPVVDVE
jgi:hypothetical protein